MIGIKDARAEEAAIDGVNHDRVHDSVRPDSSSAYVGVRKVEDEPRHLGASVAQQQAKSHSDEHVGDYGKDDVGGDV
jgi:hypothetical protein